MLGRVRIVTVRQVAQVITGEEADGRSYVRRAMNKLAELGLAETNGKDGKHPIRNLTPDGHKALADGNELPPCPKVGTGAKAVRAGFGTHGIAVTDTILAYGSRLSLTDWQVEVNHAVKETGLSFNTDAVLARQVAPRGRATPRPCRLLPRACERRGAWAGPTTPCSASASCWSWVSLSRLVLVFETHTPSFTITGSVSPLTAIFFAVPAGYRPVRAFPFHPLREGHQAALECLLRFARSLRRARGCRGGRRCLGPRSAPCGRWRRSTSTTTPRPWWRR